MEKKRSSRYVSLLHIFLLCTISDSYAHCNRIFFTLVQGFDLIFKYDFNGSRESSLGLINPDILSAMHFYVLMVIFSSLFLFGSLVSTCLLHDGLLNVNSTEAFKCTLIP